MIKYSARGFTLIEIAIVLFIVGLLIAGLLGPLETQLEARDRNATIETMDEILEILYGFAITNGRLPCPDVTGDGRADPVFDPNNATTANCNGNDEGFLPWVDLGSARGDAWGNRFRYRVTRPDFTLPDSDGICNGNGVELDLCANGNLIVQTRGDNPASGGVEGKFLLNLAETLPAIIISHGRNGFGATAVTGIARPAPPAANADELMNTDNDTNFMSRIFTDESNGCADDTDETSPLCEYDDIVKWLAPPLLNNRMVVSGQLP